MAWTPAGRRALLDTWNALEIRRLEERGLDDQARDGLDAVADEYVAGLPSVPLCTCPLSGDVVAPCLDDVDLDGLWWEESGTYRPPPMEVPETLFALTGSLALGEPIARAPFQVQPGPAAPYVIPALLDDPAMLAVLVEVPIGPHVGVATVYLADPVARERPRPNEWGAPFSWRREPDGTWSRGSVEAWVPDFDFDLRPWIDASRLLWVAPGERGGVPRSGLDGCPYLDRPGRRTWCYVRWGRARYDQEPSDYDRTISSYR